MKTLLWSLALNCGIAVLWYELPVEAQFGRPSEREYLIEQCIRNGGTPTNGGYGCVYRRERLPDDPYRPSPNQCGYGYHVCTYDPRRCCRD